jgi:hypothetical protein
VHNAERWTSPTVAMRSASREVAIAQRLHRDQPFDRLSGDLGDLELDGSPGLELRVIARSRTTGPEQTSSTLSLTKSDARGLLSIAKLNNARSRAEADISTFLGSSGRFWPTMSPLF